MTPTPHTPCTLPAWQTLSALEQRPAVHLRELLVGEDAQQRPITDGTEAAGLRLDASRQAVDAEVWQALLDLAEQAQVRAQAMAQRAGEPINSTEHRAVLHVALRGSGMTNPPWGQGVAQAVSLELKRFLAAADTLHQGRWLGSTGQAVTDVVNIGIGGSDLGPRMAVAALAAQCSGHVRVHFVSNPDAWALHATLRGLDAARTVFVVQSKTFTTQETLTLAASARRWLSDAGVVGEAQARHLIAVTASPQLSAAQGYLPENTFGFWDWVGGRYSVWSAIGLPLAAAIGAPAFEQFLAGAHAMDSHFWTAPAEHNMPLMMALLGIWNRNFLGCPTHLLSCYASRLSHFAPFVQQMDMESNGKRTHVDGAPVQIGTGPIVWGGLGIDAQHAYFQLLHQGVHRVPVDFIGVLEEDTPMPLAAEHHRVTLLNMRAQSQALALGRDTEATVAALMASGMSADDAQAMAPHRRFEGNVPNSILWLPRLDAYHLGALIALYEHKVFCQAAIWNIHAYDQWGVELGKTMAKAMEQQPSP